jgi:hypothetical protein
MFCIVHYQGLEMEATFVIERQQFVGLLGCSSGLVLPFNELIGWQPALTDWLAACTN